MIDAAEISRMLADRIDGSLRGTASGRLQGERLLACRLACGRSGRVARDQTAPTPWPMENDLCNGRVWRRAQPIEGVLGCDTCEALRWAREWLGIDQGTPESREQYEDAKRKRAIARAAREAAERE